MIRNTRSDITMERAEYPFAIFPDESSRLSKKHGDSESFCRRDRAAQPEDWNDQRLVGAAKNIALSFGRLLLSVRDHVDALEGQLGNGDMDRGHLQAIRGYCGYGANLAYRLMLFGGKMPVKMNPLDLNSKLEAMIR